MGRTRRGDGWADWDRSEPCVVSTSQRTDLGSTKQTRFAVGQKGVIANLCSLPGAPSGVRSAGECLREGGGRV